MAHHWAQTGEVRGRDKRSENAFKKATELNGIIRPAFWPEGGLHEQAVAVRVDGVREVSRDDTPREGWITGHYDYHAWLFEDELWVDDLKTGKFYPNPMPGLPGHMEDVEVGGNRYPQDVRSAQLKTYALGLSRLLSYQGRVNVSVTHWPRLPLAHRHKLPSREFVAHHTNYLAAFWGELEGLYKEKLHNERAMLGHEDSLILRPGDQCRFCPAKTNCFLAQEN